MSRSERFESWVEHAPIAIFAVDTTGHYVDANPAAVALLGYSVEELRARSMADIVDPRQLTRATGEFRALAASKQLEAEYRLRRKDGSMVEVALRAVETEPGMLVAFCQDLTGRRTAERRLTDLVLTMSDWAWEVDATGHYTWASDAVERILGYSAAEVVGRTPFDFMVPDEAARVGKAFGEAVAARAPLVALANVGRHRDGRVVHLETTGVPLFDEHGAFCGYRGADRDVTERVAHLHELVSARDAAEAGTRTKNHFLATVSHELRTPLNGVLDMAQLLEFTTLDAEQADCLATLKSSALGLLGLIEDLLEFTRLEAGRVPALTRPFRLRELLTGLVEGRRRSQREGVAVSLDIDVTCPDLLTGDDLHLLRVCEHLLDNALKFTRKGTVVVSARVRERYGKGLLLDIAVVDTGVGMTAETRQRLFGTLSPGDSSPTREFGGLGLGLTLCQRLARLMEGRLELESAPGEGTAVHLLVPMLATVTIAPSPVPLLVRGAPLHVLLVEDNAINRAYAEALLARQGHRVKAAVDGLEALEHLERERFDLVLMDLNMPRCSGLEAVKRLRERERERGTPRSRVLAVTAWATNAQQPELLGQGFDGLLEKPFDAQQFTRAIEAVLLGRSAA